MNRYLFSILIASTIFSIPSLSETMDDLVIRNELWYKKFSDIPFTGEITGLDQGSMKDGKRNGIWNFYWENGQLFFKIRYKNGIRVGRKVSYYPSGKLMSESNFNNDDLEGLTIYYHENGQIQRIGNHKNHEKVGEWIYYNSDGTIWMKETY